jgi:hypothetical protein
MAHYGGAITEADIIRDFGRPMGVGALIEVETMRSVDVAVLATAVLAAFGVNAPSD